jgi:hypothetical protein
MLAIFLCIFFDPLVVVKVTLLQCNNSLVQTGFRTLAVRRFLVLRSAHTTFLRVTSSCCSDSIFWRLHTNFSVSGTGRVARLSR